MHESIVCGKGWHMKRCSDIDQDVQNDLEQQDGCQHLSKRCWDSESMPELV